MKKAITVTIGVIVFVAVALAIIPTTRDELHWLWAAHTDETASYDSYVKTWPAGRHAGEARARYDNHGWANAQAANTVQGFERYLTLEGPIAIGAGPLDLPAAAEPVHRPTPWHSPQTPDRSQALHPTS